MGPHRLTEPAARQPVLLALGDPSGPHFDDAWAVARETMRRARHNVEQIIRRLDGMGYRFWNGKQGRAKGPPRKHSPSGTR